MADTVRIALAQTNTVVGDLDGNRLKITQNIALAKTAGADLVLFPELTIPSYFPEDLLLKNKFVEENRATLDQITSQTRDIIAIVGFVDRDDTTGNIHNAAAVLHQGEISAVYRKICLPN